MAANAVPGFGQIAGAALGLVAGLVKIFGNIDGPRKKKRRRKKQAQQRRLQAQRGLNAQGIAAGTAGAGGQLITGGQMPSTVINAQPPTPMYDPSGTLKLKKD
jgi:hypothetical protein